MKEKIRRDKYLHGRNGNRFNGSAGGMIDIIVVVEIVIDRFGQRQSLTFERWAIDIAWLHHIIGQMFDVRAVGLTLAMPVAAQNRQGQKYCEHKARNKRNKDDITCTETQQMRFVQLEEVLSLKMCRSMTDDILHWYAATISGPHMTQPQPVHGTVALEWVTAQVKILEMQWPVDRCHRCQPVTAQVDVTQPLQTGDDTWVQRRPQFVVGYDERLQ